MISRRQAFGLSRALFVGSFCLGFTTPALAQDDPAPPPATDTKPADAPAEADKPAEPTPSEPKPEEKPAAAVEAKAEVATPAGPAEPPAVAADPEREKAVAAIGIERLPGSAFPEPQPRGIKGGSLWFTMHGLQWPYMPAMAGEPATRVGISGSIWSDLSYARIFSGDKGQTTNRTRWASQSRGVLRVTPTHSTKQGWFGQGQVELVAKGDNTEVQTLETTDDLYVRFGKWNLVDLTVGRFQAWELAHYGMGLDLNTFEREGAKIAGIDGWTPPGVYGLTYLWDRPNSRLGYYALHAYPTKFLRFELLSQLGTGSGAGDSINAGFRPMGILDLGFVKLKLGYEYNKAIPQQDERSPLVSVYTQRNRKVGYGAALQFVLNPFVEGGAHYAIGFQDVRGQKNVDDLRSSNTTWSAGGFLNGRVIKDFIVGGGLLAAHLEDLEPNPTPGINFNRVNEKDQFFGYFALQYSLWDSIYFKFVGSHAWYKSYDSKAPPFSNNMLGGRFRMMVLF
jgi:hypothetical protein